MEQIVGRFMFWSWRSQQRILIVVRNLQSSWIDNWRNVPRKCSHRDVIAAEWNGCDDRVIRNAAYNSQMTSSAEKNSPQFTYFSNSCEILVSMNGNLRQYGGWLLPRCVFVQRCKLCESFNLARTSEKSLFGSSQELRESERKKRWKALRLTSLATRTRKKSIKCKKGNKTCNSSAITLIKRNFVEKKFNFSTPQQ